jgi:hypothetical protein
VKPSYHKHFGERQALKIISRLTALFAVMGIRGALPAFALLSLTIMTSAASAQSIKEKLAGTWILISSQDTRPDGTKTDAFGPNPLGMLMFDASGHFSQIFMRADLPKTESRNKGTPEQDRAVVAGSNAYFGTYSVDEASQTINQHYLGSTFAAFTGRDAKRIITSLTADELKLRIPTTSTGVVAETVFRRAK